MPVQAAVQRKNKRKGQGRRFFTHPLFIAGSLLLARFGLDLFAQTILEKHQERREKESHRKEE